MRGDKADTKDTKTANRNASLESGHGTPDRSNARLTAGNGPLTSVSSLRSRLRV